jgi:polar amino acid transport system substrate-binding protein
MAWRTLLLLVLAALQPLAWAAGLDAPDPGAPLYAQLPPEIRKAGVLRFVGDSHPPYRIVSDDRRISDGIEPDMARALEKLLGVPIHHHVVNSLSATLAGLEAGRYDVALGPGVATQARQKRFDGVSWMTTRPSFVYPNDKPRRYTQVTDLCGRKVSYVAGSVTERVLNRLIDLCEKKGLPPAIHVPLVDTNMTLVATQAGRSELAGMTLTAALHAVHENGDRFGMYSDAAGSLGLDVLSLFVPKRSGLAPVMLAAMNALIASGEYDRITDRWGVSAVRVQKSQLNVAK